MGLVKGWLKAGSYGASQLASMQTNQSRAKPLLSGLYTPKSSIPLP